MAPGFVYACCRQDQLNAVKIGFTTTNPHQYTSAFSRTLCPLQVLFIRPYANARLAEKNVFHCLSAYRINPQNEVFDLSSQEGLHRLKSALDHSSNLDSVPGLSVPMVPGKLDKKQRKRNAVLLDINRPENAEDKEFKAAAKRVRMLVRVQEEEKARHHKKQEQQKQIQEIKNNQTGAKVAMWLQKHVHPGGTNDFVTRAKLYAAYKAMTPQEACSKTALGKSAFLTHLLSILGEKSFKEQIFRQDANYKGAFIGWKLNAALVESRHG